MRDGGLNKDLAWRQWEDSSDILMSWRWSTRRVAVFDGNPSRRPS